MKVTSSNRLVIGLLLSATLWDCPDLEASRKMDAVARSTDVDRAMSANESLLLRFQKEKEELLTHRDKTTPPHQVKNKIKILDNKITFLEEEIKRTKKISPKKTAAGTPAAPVLRLKAYAEPEPRRRIYLAYAPEMARFQRGAGPEVRQMPQTGPLPYKVQPKPASVTEERDQPATASLAEKPKLRAKTGADWRGMSRADKEIYMLSVLGNLSRHDIFLERSYVHYIEVVDEALKEDPSQDSEYVQRIVLRNAYTYEPEARKDIEKVWK